MHVTCYKRKLENGKLPTVDSYLEKCDVAVSVVKRCESVSIENRTKLCSTSYSALITYMYMYLQ